VYDADEMTPLTSEKLIYNATANTAGTTPNVTCDTVVSSATQTQWNAARLRLRWEYVINASEEAIRLDPQTPSLAVGNPLPTGYLTGGAGLWAGNSGGSYLLRIGEATGTSLRWDGVNLKIKNSNGADVIVLDNAGNSSFQGAMTLGTDGGIYQGTGSFSSPTAGIKLWNSSGDGRYSTFSGSGEKVRINKDGIQLLADSGATFTKPSSLTWSDTIGGTAFASIGAHSANIDPDGTRPDDSKGSLVFIKDGSNVESILSGGTTRLILNSANDYALLSNADLYVKESGIAVGYTATPALNRGQIAIDFAGEHDFNAIVMQDTVDVDHDMGSVVGAATFGALGKYSATAGALAVTGAGEGQVGVNLDGNVVSEASATSTTAVAPVMTSSWVRSGSGPNVTTLGATSNLFVVRNGTTTAFIVKGNGNFHYDGAGSAYDGEDDIGMVRTLAKELWSGVIDQEWDRFITHNRQSLVDAGIISEAGFINGPALLRLIVGALGQLNTRLVNVENSRGIAS
jgi:hypothetical protein